MSTLKIMTFNLRVRTENDGKNMFDYRTDKIKALIDREKPDIIGFQEVTTTMLNWLKTNLPDYDVLGHGRGPNYNGEGVPIAFRKDLFDLHAFREEWLSLRPQAPNSAIKGIDQSKYPRVMNCAELIHRETHRPIAFFNTHTDHRGETARVVENTILMRAVAACPFPFLATGDFNARPDAMSIKLITETAEELGTVDATAGIAGSFHGYTGDVKDHKIDYIFTNLKTDPAKSYAIADDDACGCYYSDHNALCAFVELD